MVHPISSVVDPRELPLLLEHRGVALGDWLMRVVRAVQVQDRTTVCQGQEQIRELAHLVDQVLDQLLDRWEPGQVHHWPALLLIQEDAVLEVWVQRDVESQPAKVGGLVQDAGGWWRSVEQLAWPVNATQPEEAARQLLRGLGEAAAGNVRRVGGA